MEAYPDWRTGNRLMEPVTAAALLVKTLHDKSVVAAATPLVGESLWTTVLRAGVIPALVGLTVFVIVEFFVRPLMKPRLVVDFDETITGCRLDSPAFYPITGQQINAVYIRLKVSNVGWPKIKHWPVAKNARGYLYNVERRNESGVFEPTGFSDVLPLCWAFEGVDTNRQNKPKVEGITLLKGAPDFVDICAAFENDRKLYHCLLYKPVKYNDLFERHGTYRLSIVVTAEDTKPVEKQILIENWQGDYKALKGVS
jgi:hypothetical protein